MDMRQWDRNRVMTVLAAAVLLAVVGYWGWAWNAAPGGDAPARARLANAASPALDPAAIAALVGLLSPGSVRTDVQVHGVLAATHAPLALLSIDGAPAQAFAPGQRLGPATRLAAVSADGVQLEQAGQLRVLPAPMLPPLPQDGIVPLPSAASP